MKMYKWARNLLVVLLIAVSFRFGVGVGAKDRTVPVASYETKRMALYEQPPIYRTWWIEAMQCTGLYIPLERANTVQFQWIAAQTFSIRGDSDSTATYYGVTEPWNNRITVVQWMIENPITVKHEMVHFLMYQYGLGGGHPPRFFNACGLVG